MAGNSTDPGSADPGSAGEAGIATSPSQVVVAPVPAAPPIRVSSGFGVWLRDLVISLAISAFIIIFLYQPVKVEGTSMMPSLDDQERIFVNKFVYRLEPIERGDIVVFRYPRDPSKSFIKRVIWLAGDRIRIDVGRGLRQRRGARRRLRSRRPTPISAPIPRWWWSSANSYFVLGDHRTMSNDSRDFGPGRYQSYHLRQGGFRILAHG